MKKAAASEKQLAIKHRVMTRKVKLYGLTKEDLEFIINMAGRECTERPTAADNVDSIMTASA